MLFVHSSFIFFSKTIAFQQTQTGWLTAWNWFSFCYNFTTLQTTFAHWRRCFWFFFNTVGKNIDKADNEINKVNKDLKDVLNDPSSCCQNQILNLILCVVVLGIAGVVFNMVTKQNGQWTKWWTIFKKSEIGFVTVH